MAVFVPLDISLSVRVIHRSCRVQAHCNLLIHPHPQGYLSLRSSSSPLSIHPSTSTSPVSCPPFKSRPRSGSVAPLFDFHTLPPPPPPKNLIPAPCLVVDSIRCDLSPLALLSFKFVLYTPTRPNLPSIRRLKISSSHPHQTLHHIPHHLPSLRLTIVPGALQ